MILISGSEDTGFEATVKMGVKSPALEIVIDLLGKQEDISGNEFKIKIENSSFPMTVEDGVAKLSPSSINLATGIYPFSLFMDGKSILQGYFEWLGDDN